MFLSISADLNNDVDQTTAESLFGSKTMFKTQHDGSKAGGLAPHAMDINQQLGNMICM